MESSDLKIEGGRGRDEDGGMGLEEGGKGGMRLKREEWDLNWDDEGVIGT